nr:hypothetical protein [uncultured Flavobacterium sp.]
MIVNFLVGIISWFIIISVCYLIYNLFKKERIEKASILKILYWSIGFSILANSSYLFSQKLTENKQKSYSLSEQDAIVVKSILKFSMSMDTVSKEMHSDFWRVVNRNGGNPNNIKELGTKENLINFINETGMFYQREFYKDALISYKSGKVYESEYRKKLNQSIKKDRLAKNTALMKKIATKTPIQYEGKEVVLDEEIISRIFENLDFAFVLLKHNLDILYSKPNHK